MASKSSVGSRGVILLLWLIAMPARAEALHETSQATHSVSQTSGAMTELPTGAVDLTSYVAGSEVLKQFVDDGYDVLASNTFHSADGKPSKEYPKNEADWNALLARHPDATGNCSKLEKMAIAIYTGQNSFEDLNSFLWALPKISGRKKLAPAYSLGALVTASALHCLNGYSGILSRGGDIPDAALKDYVSGNVVVDKGFTSTAKGPRTSDAYTTAPVQFLIFDGHGADIQKSGETAFQMEREVLLPPGTRFRVLKRLDNPLNEPPTGEDKRTRRFVVLQQLSATDNVTNPSDPFSAGDYKISKKMFPISWEECRKSLVQDKDWSRGFQCVVKLEPLQPEETLLMAFQSEVRQENKDRVANVSLSSQNGSYTIHYEYNPLSKESKSWTKDQILSDAQAVISELPQDGALLVGGKKAP